jgi:hypothetical protein
LVISDAREARLEDEDEEKDEDVNLVAPTAF